MKRVLDKQYVGLLAIGLGVRLPRQIRSARNHFGHVARALRSLASRMLAGATVGLANPNRLSEVSPGHGQCFEFAPKARGKHKDSKARRCLTVRRVMACP